MVSLFKDDFNFDDRLAESVRIREKYPERIPFIVEQFIDPKATPDSQTLLPPLDKKKYLVPSDLTFGQFAYSIRKRMSLDAEKALFFFINGSPPSMQMSLAELYEKHADKDGFVYVQYSAENCFGFPIRR